MGFSWYIPYSKCFCLGRRRYAGRALTPCEALLTEDNSHILLHAPNGMIHTLYRVVYCNSNYSSSFNFNRITLSTSCHQSQLLRVIRIKTRRTNAVGIENKKLLCLCLVLTPINVTVSINFNKHPLKVQFLQ